jgi:mRNA-degrading endonuclease RelE of RelBE toxin-antitoxin system
LVFDAQSAAAGARSSSFEEPQKIGTPRISILPIHGLAVRSESTHRGHKILACFIAGTSQIDHLRHCRIIPQCSASSRLFTKLVLDYMTDDEYSALQKALMTDPEAGPVIPGSGGVRKLRWAAPGRGKRGGYRVIYYLRRAHGVIWMLTMYPKNVADNIPAHILRQIRKEVEDG